MTLPSPNPAAIEALIDAAANEVLQLLTDAAAVGLPGGAKVRTFIRVNGVEDVITAAEITVRRIELHKRGGSTPVADAWEYLVAVLNGRPARLRYLYLMLCLWESSLRARIALVLQAATGSASWYRDPTVYLAVGSIRRVFETNKDIASVDTSQPGGYTVHESLTTAASFLEKLYLPDLHRIVLDNWRIFAPAMLDPNNGKLPYREAQELFAAVYRLRKTVMHVGRIDNAYFKQSAALLRRALSMLEFDVDKAISRIYKRKPDLEDMELFE